MLVNLILVVVIAISAYVYQYNKQHYNKKESAISLFVFGVASLIIGVRTPAQEDMWPLAWLFIVWGLYGTISPVSWVVNRYLTKRRIKRLDMIDQFVWNLTDSQRPKYLAQALEWAWLNPALAQKHDVDTITMESDRHLHNELLKVWLEITNFKI